MTDTPDLGEIVWIAHADLRPGPNPRRTFDDDEIAALAESIAAQGLLQNLVVTLPLLPDMAANGVRVIVAGERRWRAIGRLIEQGRWAEDRPLPCRLVDADPGTVRALSILENLQRQDVPPLEEAEAFRDLRQAAAARALPLPHLPAEGSRRMTGLEELRARAATLRWAAEQLDNADPMDAHAYLNGLAHATEAAAELVARDYAEPADAEPAETEIEPAEEPPETPAGSPPLPHAGEGRGEGDEKRQPEAPAPQPPRRGPASSWTDEQLAELTRRFHRGETPKEIAEAMGLDADNGGTKRVANKLFALGLRRSSVPLPNPAEQQAAEDAAQAEVADADLATIRHWLETKGGMPLATDTPALMVLKHANDARRRFGLPPFRLVRRPSEPTQDELARMTRAGEHHA